MNLPTHGICLPSVAASCLPIATRSILSPLITTVAFGITLPSAGLITVAPISEYFSACTVATTRSANKKVVSVFISGFWFVCNFQDNFSARVMCLGLLVGFRRVSQWQRLGNDRFDLSCVDQLRDFRELDGIRMR